MSLSLQTVEKGQSHMMMVIAAIRMKILNNDHNIIIKHVLNLN